MFNYEKLENDIVTQMKATLQEWSKAHEGIYITALCCDSAMDYIWMVGNTEAYLNKQASPDSEDYYYYKYCEEEWALWDADGLWEDCSNSMKAYKEEKEAVFTNPSTFEYEEAFEEHRSKVIDSCKKALSSFRAAINNDFPDLLLSFDIREYLDAKTREEIFTALNSASAAKEYAEQIDSFC